MKTHLITILVISIIYLPNCSLNAAFENSHIRSAIFSIVQNSNKNDYVYLNSQNYMSFPFLDSYGFGVQKMIRKTPVALSVYMTGDKLYNEMMINVSAGHHLSRHFEATILLSGYKVSILNHGSVSTLSMGLSTTYLLRTDLELTVLMDNIGCLSQKPINDDIPKRGEISLISTFLPGQSVNYSMIQDYPYPLDHRFFWQSEITNNITIKGGITSNPQSYIGCSKLRYIKMSLIIGYLFNPILGNILNVGFEWG